jgi:signal peptidase I
MKWSPIKIIGAAIGAAMVAGLWVFFAPTNLGGSTTYSVTSGISMQPMLYKNDLALVRAESSYHVGDVVLYQNQVLHRPVLHRIILIQNGNYFFKGDNNNFVDPGYATRTELTGKLWFHIGGVGAALGWFGQPRHAAPLAGLAAMVVVLTGATTTQRKRSRRRRSRTSKRHYENLTVGDRVPTESPKPSGAEPPIGDRRARATQTPQDVASNGMRSPARERRSGIAMTPQQLSARHPPAFLDGPTSMLALIGGFLVIALILLGVGFGRPTQKLAPLPGAYQQLGSFSYSAAVNAPTPVYPSGFVRTGEPIYSSLVDSVVLNFKYQFASALSHHLKGTIKLDALLLSQTNTWQRLTTVKAITAFSGDRTSVTSSLPLQDLYTLIANVSTQSGGASQTYSADIQPIIHITGTVDNKPIDATFSPVLPFTVTQTTITLDDAVAPAPPGATYVAPSASTALSSTTHPTQTGSIPHLVANEISVAKYDIPVPILRVLGFVFGALALILAGLHELTRRRKSVRSDEELIASRLHSLIVPVVSLSAPGVAIDVPSFAHLAGLAQFLEQPILYEISDGNRTYAIDDDAHRYVYRPSLDREAAPSTGEVARDAKPRDAKEPSRRTSSGSSWRRRSKRATAARAGAGLLTLIVAATLVTSFTASTSVPVSHVGASLNARQFSQITPAGCSSLGVTALVNGSGHFSNTLSHALIVGSADADHITDSGQDNCIVGGGGADIVNASSTDVCIIGPTSGAAYHQCVTSPS